GDGYRPYGFDPTSPSARVAGYHSYARSAFGIDYAVNRHYDSETGRYLQPDPLGEAVYRLDDPQTLNLYSFRRANPINRRDPLGLDDSDGCKWETTLSGLTCVYPVTRSFGDTTVTGKDVQSWIPNTYWGWQGLGGPLFNNDKSLEDTI